MSQLHPDQQLPPLNPPPQSQTWILGVIFGTAGLFVCLCLILPIVIIVVLALLGPAIGNVFSGIIEDLVTPTPTPGLILMELYAWDDLLKFRV